MIVVVSYLETINKLLNKISNYMNFPFFHELQKKSVLAFIHNLILIEIK